MLWTLIDLTRILNREPNSLVIQKPGQVHSARPIVVETKMDDVIVVGVTLYYLLLLSKAVMGELAWSFCTV